MPTDTQLLPDPILDNRDEADRIAARLYRSIGGLSQPDAQLIIEYGESLAAMIGNNYLLSFSATSIVLTFGDPNGTPSSTPALLTIGLSATTIQAALAALSTVGNSGVTVTDNGDGTFTISFSTSIPGAYVLTGIATGGNAQITVTPEPNEITDPLLPELSSARPAEAHVVLLEELERASTETLFRFNQLPDKNRVGMLRLLGVTVTPAKAATTTLLFTKTPDYLNIDVFIPAGTGIATQDQKVSVTTDTDLDMPPGQATGIVTATATQVGNIGRLQSGALSLLQVAIAGILSVTNSTVLAGGVDGETVDQAKIRARELMNIGQHLGNAIDWVNYIFFNVLNRKGRITPFEGYLANFATAPGLGYLLLVVQDDAGAVPAQAVLNNVSALIASRHVAGLQVSVTGPVFKAFSLSVNVTIGPGAGAAQLIAKATANLQAFYSPLTFAYGPAVDSNGNVAVRYISLSDIIGQIEAAGPQQISAKDVNGQFQITITINGANLSTDVALSVGELPQLVSVMMTVVS